MGSFSRIRPVWTLVLLYTLNNFQILFQICWEKKKRTQSSSVSGTAYVAPKISSKIIGAPSTAYVLSATYASEIVLEDHDKAGLLLGVPIEPSSPAGSRHR